MRIPPIRFLWVLGGFIAFSVAVVLWSGSSTDNLRREADEARVRARALQDLGDRRDALAAQQPTTSQLEQIQREALALEAEQATLDGMRADLQRSTLEAMNRAAAPAAPTREPPSRLTPETTIQSVIRAIAGGEAAELADLISFDPEAQDEADGFFASLPEDLQTQFGSPQALVAHIMAAKTRVIDSMPAVDALARNGPDHASLRVRWSRDNGAPRTANFELERAGDGWALRVPAKVIEGYRALVTGVFNVEVASGD